VRVNYIRCLSTFQGEQCCKYAGHVGDHTSDLETDWSSAVPVLPHCTICGYPMKDGECTSKEIHALVQRDAPADFVPARSADELIERIRPAAPATKPPDAEQERSMFEAWVTNMEPAYATSNLERLTGGRGGYRVHNVAIWWMAWQERARVAAESSKK
jgi:hypothetical protein